MYNMLNSSEMYWGVQIDVQTALKHYLALLLNLGNPISYDLAILPLAMQQKINEKLCQRS